MVVHCSHKEKNWTSLFQHFDKYFLLYLSLKQAGWFSSMPIESEPRKYSEKFKVVAKSQHEINTLRYKTCIHTALVGILFIQCIFSTYYHFGKAPDISDQFLVVFCLLCNGVQACYLHFSQLNKSKLEWF